MRSWSALRYTLKTLLKRPEAITSELLEELYQAANRPGAGRAWNIFQRNEITLHGTKTCYMDRLDEIRIPTLIIHGRPGQPGSARMRPGGSCVHLVLPPVLAARGLALVPTRYPG